MTTAQRIAEMLTGDDVLLVEELEAETRQATIADVLTDLAEFAKDATATEKAGLLAAIEIIKSNYGA